jgi:CRP-like cAMP-binding protein
LIKLPPIKAIGFVLKTAVKAGQMTITASSSALPTIELQRQGAETSNDTVSANSVTSRLNEIFSSAPTFNCAAKIQIFQQGDSTEWVFWMTSGIVKLIHLDQDGREVIVGLRCPGSLLGATAIILNQEHATTAETLTRCELLQIPSNEFRNVLKTKPTFSELLHQLQAQESVDHLVRLIELASLSTNYRLARLLVDISAGIQSEEPSAGRNVRIPLKQWEIAELLAITPEHTNRLIRRFEREGLVTRDGKIIVVPDPQRLLCLVDR